uniref:Uncharacterized protein n=1 Tax=Arundo donax TaxID=35708 RepID=A0A0A9IPX2_ARUDO
MVAEETKNSTVNSAAEMAPAPANNAKVDASPEAETDDMVIDEVNAATEDVAELDPNPEKTPMEEAIRVTRARLRRRAATGTTAAAASPAVN